MDEECNKYLYGSMARPFSARIVVALALFHVSGLFPPVVHAAQSPVIAVIYPELEEPYRGVLSSIIEGIQGETKEATRLFPMGDGYDISQLIKAINPEHIAAIIALGRTGLAAAERWRGKIPIVVGALLLTPDKNERGLAGISLAADPEILLARLKLLDPSVKRVHVVFSSKSSEWLVEIARDSIKKFKLQLYTYKSEDIKGSALIYRDILSKSRPGEDAIWLLPDPVAVDYGITLPLLLRGAWDNNLLLFSSNPAYVQRGALFALFPDNKLMGESLARMAESYLSDDPADMGNSVVPLKDLQAAINLRTAEHIGLTLSSEERKDYALIFPAP
jgi:ABC-type uncharacterized transport system substrate-binding protein